MSGARDANPPVNRYLDDKAMDRIDHALGRPVWPPRETWRNHFAIETGARLATDFDASPHWRLRGSDGRMLFYSVTDAGRQALAAHLAALPATKQHRAYVVSFDGRERIVSAKSRASARYNDFLEIRDCWCELTFGEYLRHSAVRVAA